MWPFKTVEQETAKRVTVTLLDHDRLHPESVEIDAKDFGRRILVAGQRYEHCSTADDSTWEYEPMR